jgi:26S proteasome regulatory subunit N9
MLDVFNTGDLHGYDALCAKYASVLNAQPALVEHERRLREKVRKHRGCATTCMRC